MLKKYIFTFILVVSTFALQGCMPVTKPFAPTKIEANKALIYIYRPESFISRGLSWVVDINGQEYSDYFINNGYIPISISPGNVTIALKEFSLTKGTFDTLTINGVKNGSTYYVKAIAKPFFFHKLQLMDERTGAVEISKTVYFVKQ